ncbi:MAG TPA: DUF2254 domain-containing protein [Pseudonocardia sp.]
MVRRDAVAEYVRGSLWALPTVVAVVALVAGMVLSLLPSEANSPFDFQGTADDARSLLIGISSTMVTVIALLLGLAVVALQLSSTQFSPRLLRNFLRDRPNQLVLSVFVGTFVYSAAGLFTVGVTAGSRTENYPRLAVSVAIVLLFVSLALLVYFADHLAHSIQVDRIMRVAESATLEVIPTDTAVAPPPPPWAVLVPALRSGYVQTVDAAHLAARAARAGLAGVSLVQGTGEHVVAGTPLATVWTATGDGAGPAPAEAARVVDACVRMGWERTFEQDPGLGVRQLVDIACKALSPGINDPYTAVQATEHLGVVFSALAATPDGDRVARSGDTVVVVPQRTFAEHLSLGCGLIRRYGAAEPTVAQALLRMLGVCARLGTVEHLAAVAEEAALIVAQAQRADMLAADLAEVQASAAELGDLLEGRVVAVSSSSARR